MLPRNRKVHATRHAKIAATLYLTTCNKNSHIGNYTNMSYPVPFVFFPFPQGFQVTVTLMVGCSCVGRDIISHPNPCHAKVSQHLHGTPTHTIKVSEIREAHIHLKKPQTYGAPRLHPWNIKNSELETCDLFFYWSSMMPHVVIKMLICLNLARPDSAMALSC